MGARLDRNRIPPCAGGERRLHVARRRSGVLAGAAARADRSGYSLFCAAFAIAIPDMAFAGLDPLRSAGLPARADRGLLRGRCPRCAPRRNRARVPRVRVPRNVHEGPGAHVVLVPAFVAGALILDKRAAFRTRRTSSHGRRRRRRTVGGGLGPRSCLATTRPSNTFTLIGACSAGRARPRSTLAGGRRRADYPERSSPSPRLANGPRPGAGGARHPVRSRSDARSGDLLFQRIERIQGTLSLRPPARCFRWPSASTSGRDVPGVGS